MIRRLTYRVLVLSDLSDGQCMSIKNTSALIRSEYRDDLRVRGVSG
jgi:hypothetical protein